jgi:MSHA biogenesis protein MshK
MSRRRLRTFVAAAVLAAGALGCAVEAAAARDPMRPPRPVAAPAAARPVPEPVLTAIIGSDARRVAIVNGRVVRAGDRVDGADILAVLEDGIRYGRAGVARELKLPSAVAVKRPAGTDPAGAGSGR